MSDNIPNTMSDNIPTVEERLATLEEQISDLWVEFGRLQSTITDLININNEEKEVLL